MTWRLSKIVAALVCGLLFSQLPGFAQQYHQRLAGRLDVALDRAAEIEADARDMNLSVEAYIALFLESDNHALEGRRMRDSLARAERLQAYERSVNEAPPILAPLVVVARLDPSLGREVLRLYRPQLALAPHGLAYALAGAVIGLLVLLAAHRGVTRLGAISRATEAAE